MRDNGGDCGATYLSQGIELERRLAAVLAADVAGFSRLTDKDEVGTLRLLAAQRAILDDAIARHRGRIANTAGDSVLAEFPSAVNAVQCAVEAQQALRHAVQEVAEDQRVLFRIGIHVGDVIVRGGDLLGVGVNVAARLETLAKAGGIVISAAAYDQVRKILPLAYIDLGLQSVKNIDEPVRTFAIGISGAEPISSSDSKPLALPDKPSLAVLPFDNMSDDHSQEYFSDGISEDLTTALSKFEWLFVIARNSAFTYKGKAVNVRQVGHELGVRYVLEGSVRRAGDRVRVNAQLIETESIRHVWAQRYDRRMDDVFELQDDIVASIAMAVGPEITLAEIERSRAKRPADFDAWDHYLRAVSAYHRMTKQDMDDAAIDLQRAIDIDRGFAKAYALLGLCHAQIGMHGWSRPVRSVFQEARRWADRAVRIAPASPEAHQSLAFVLAATGEAEQAVRVARRAIELNPNFSEAYAVLGQAQIFCGNLEAGMDACHRAERSNPRDSRGTWLYDAMGHGYFFLGEYERAIEVSKKGLHQDPALFGALVTLACTYAYQGRNAEADQCVKDLLGLIPRFSLQALRKNPMFVDKAMVEKLVEGMRLAGLPE